MTHGADLRGTEGGTHRGAGDGRCLILRVLRGLRRRTLLFVGDKYKRLPGGVQLVWKEVSSNRASDFLVSLRLRQNICQEEFKN